MKKNNIKCSCPVFSTVQLIGNKWVLVILNKLLNGTMRFGELRKEIEEISPKMLTQQLRKMEKDGIVTREIFPEIPPKVEYSLTMKGRELKPVLDSISLWGKKYAKQ